MKKAAAAFSMIEILLALVFVSFAFLPIYNLFRFGQAGTMSNVREIEATNHASDLINFLREKDYTDIHDILGSQDNWVGAGDSKIKELFPTWTNQVGGDYARTLSLQEFKGNKAGLGGLTGMIDNIIHQRRSVPCYLAEVKVKVIAKRGVPTPDTITLFTIIMD